MLIKICSHKKILFVKFDLVPSIVRRQIADYNSIYLIPFFLLNFSLSERD